MAEVVVVIAIEMAARMMMEILLTIARLTLLLVHKTSRKSRHTCSIHHISSLLNASLFYHEIVVLLSQNRLLE